MKDAFRGYYPPTSEELEKLWSEGLIVLDANALLNLFRYSVATRDDLLKLLRKEKDRLWLPHQAALEFHRNRRSVLAQQTAAFRAIIDAISDADDRITAAIDALRRNATVEAGNITELLKKHIHKLRRGVKKARKAHLKAVVNDSAEHETLLAITELYDGKVGPAYNSDALKSLYKEGEERYAKQIPPGFKDVKKEGDRKYGDLVLWKQILDHASKAKKPMLFITNDVKEDWWDRTAGKTNGPRPELVDDYYEASGERIHFYELRRFLDHAHKRGAKIRAESVEEASEVSRAERRAASLDALVRKMSESSGLYDSAGRLAEPYRHATDSFAKYVAAANTPSVADMAAAMNRSFVGPTVMSELSKRVAEASGFNSASILNAAHSRQRSSLILDQFEREERERRKRHEELARLLELDATDDGDETKPDEESDDGDEGAVE